MEFLRSLFLSSSEPRLLMRRSLDGMIVTESFRSQFVNSALKSCGALESRRLEFIDFIPESAEESRLRRGGGS